MKIEKFEKKVTELTDEDIIQMLAVLLRDRVRIGTAFLHDSNKLVIGHKVVLVVGDIAIEGDPRLFDWPLQHLPIPEAFKNEYPEKFN